MTDLPPRKFELGERAQVVIYENGDKWFDCRVIGYEDGRNLDKHRGGCDGWCYHVDLIVCKPGVVTHTRIVGEDRLRKVKAK